MRKNTNILLNERNKYVFILTILEELDDIDTVKDAKSLQYAIAADLSKKL